MLEPDTEYVAIREEMMTVRRIQAQIAIGAPTLSLGYLGILIQNGLPTGNASLKLLILIPILIWSNYFVFDRRRTVFRLAKYIQVFIEDDGRGIENRFSILHSLGSSSPPWLFHGTVLAMASWFNLVVTSIIVGITILGILLGNISTYWIIAPLLGFGVFIAMLVLLEKKNRAMPNEFYEMWRQVQMNETQRDKAPQDTIELNSTP